MPIDPAVLARNLSSLATMDAEQDLPGAMQQLASAAKALLRVDGAGLMLADECGELRWATASDQQTQIIEEGQERLGQGPCVNAHAAPKVEVPKQNDRQETKPDRRGFAERSVEELVLAFLRNGCTQDAQAG